MCIFFCSQEFVEVELSKYRGKVRWHATHAALLQMQP